MDSSYNSPSGNSSLNALYDDKYSLVVQQVEQENILDQLTFELQVCLGQATNLNTSSCVPALLLPGDKSHQFTMASTGIASSQFASEVDQVKEDLVSEASFAGERRASSDGVFSVVATATGITVLGVLASKITEVVEDKKWLESVPDAAKAKAGEINDLLSKTRYELARREYLMNRNRWGDLGREYLDDLFRSYMKTFDVYDVVFLTPDQPPPLFYKDPDWIAGVYDKYIKDIERRFDSVLKQTRIDIRNGKDVSIAYFDLLDMHDRFKNARGGAGHYLLKKGVEEIRSVNKNMKLYDELIHFKALYRKAEAMMDSKQNIKNFVDTQILPLHRKIKRTYGPLYELDSFRDSKGLSNRSRAKRITKIADIASERGLWGSAKAAVAVPKPAAAPKKIVHTNKLVVSKNHVIGGKVRGFLGWGFAVIGGVAVIVGIVSKAKSKTITDLDSLSSVSADITLKDMLNERLAENTEPIPMSVTNHDWKVMTSLDPSISEEVPSVKSMLKVVATQISKNYEDGDSIQVCLPQEAEGAQSGSYPRNCQSLSSL